MEGVNRDVDGCMDQKWLTEGVMLLVSVSPHTHTHIHTCIHTHVRARKRKPFERTKYLNSAYTDEAEQQ